MANLLGDVPANCCAREYSMAQSGTPVGSAAAFAKDADYIVVWANKAIFIARTAAGTTSPAAGALYDRIYVAANERRIAGWSGKGFFFVNAVVAETPVCYVEGLS